MIGAIQQAQRPKDNPLLSKIVENATKDVPENLRDQFDRIMVVAGKLMWSDEASDERAAFDQQIQQAGNVPEVVAHAVLKVVSIIQNESKAKKPLDAMGLAAPIFMAYMLQYVEAKLGMPVTNAIIDETGQLVQVNLLKLYGVTDAHVQELIRMRAAEQSEPSAGPRDETDVPDDLQGAEA